MKPTWLLLLAAVATVVRAEAAGFSTVDRGVASLGAGGTGTARADDPAANVYNPAAAATDRGFVASFGVVFGLPSLTAESAAWSSPSDDDLLTPPMLHVRFANESFAAGASLTVPFGSSVNWPVEWPGRFELVKAKLTVLRASAFAGVQLDRFALAAGPFVDFGSLFLRRKLDFVEEEGTTELDMNARGFGVTLAAFYRPIDALALGLTYHSRSKLDFSGYADFNVPPEFSGRAADGAITSRVQLPDRAVLGALYRINPELDLALDLELVVWSTIDRLAIDFEREGMNDQIQPRDWSTTLAPRLGATYRPLALSWLTARAGVFLDPSPVPTDTVGPSSPDSTRVGLSLGAGAALWEPLTLDAGYQLIVLTGARSLNGVSYSGLVQLLGVALSYRL